MLRVSGAFATRFMEELRRVGLAVPLVRSDLGTSPEEHRQVEDLLDAMKYNLVKVLLQEPIIIGVDLAKNNSPSPTISLDKHPPLS